MTEEVAIEPVHSHAGWVWLRGLEAKDISLLLALVTFLLYFPVYRFDFVNYDDPDYVSENFHVTTGLRKENVVWAFTSLTGGVSYWHPLTWLSHMVDCQLFGVGRPGGHHLTNVLIHTANTVLVFAVLNIFTGAGWRSALIAAFFGWHPINVESVAWIAERKTLLCTLFWFLALYVYHGYVRRPRFRTYLTLLTVFGCSLMAKPMSVTLPFVLGLIDFWPLRRLHWSAGREAKKQALFLVAEKLPLLALSLLVCAGTLIGQQGLGVLPSLGELTLSDRLGNAVLAYARYIKDVFWPSDLRLSYIPHGPVADWQIWLALVLLAAATLAVLSGVRKRAHLVTGWFWYLGTLMPMIGIVQSGFQTRADRYMYLPIVGLLVMVIWIGADVGQRRGAARVGLVLAVISLVACILTTRVQLKHWRDSVSLWTQCIRFDPRNFIAQNNLGKAYLQRGQVTEAIHHFTMAHEQMPAQDFPRVNLANALLAKGDRGAAMAHYEAALKGNPLNAYAHSGQGYALLESGETVRGIASLEKAVKLNPQMHGVCYRLAREFIQEHAGPAHDATRALYYAKKGCEITLYQEPELLRLLGRAYALKGEYTLAVQNTHQALTLVNRENRQELIAPLNAELLDYRRRAGIAAPFK